MPTFDWLADRALAETVRCPYCHVAVGVSCRRPHDGRELANFPAHPARLRIAAAEQNRTGP